MSLSHMIGSADSAPTCAPNREVGKKGRQLLTIPPVSTTLHTMGQGS